MNSHIEQWNNYEKIVELSKLCRKLVASNAKSRKLSGINIEVEVTGFKNFQKTLTIKKKVNVSLNMNYMMLKRKI